MTRMFPSVRDRAPLQVDGAPGGRRCTWCTWQFTTILSFLFASVVAGSGCRMQPPPMPPEAQQQRRDADASGERLKRKSAALDEEEANLNGERSAVEDERSEVIRLHANAIERHAQVEADFQRYEAALARAGTLSGEACSELDGASLEDVLEVYGYLSRLSASPEKDAAIRELEKCRTKTASRLRTLARAGPSDAEIKKDIVRQSIASTPGNCPCPYHRASNGYRCGRRSSYSRYGGRVVKCGARDVSKDDVAHYRASLDEDPLLAFRDRFSEAWATRAGDVPLPAPAGPRPAIPPEVRSRVAQLDGQLADIDSELSLLAGKKSVLEADLGVHARTIEQQQRDEGMRRNTWRAKQQRRASRGEWVGIGVGGLGAASTLVGLYELRKPTETRQGLTMMIGFGVGVPLAVLGAVVWATSKQRGRKLRTVSTPGGQLQVRF